METVHSDGGWVGSPAFEIERNFQKLSMKRKKKNIYWWTGERKDKAQSENNDELHFHVQRRQQHHQINYFGNDLHVFLSQAHRKFDARKVEREKNNILENCFNFLFITMLRRNERVKMHKQTSTR